MSTPSPAVAETVAEIKGHLQKKTKHGRWQRRWFETKGCFLTYFKEDGSQILAAINMPQVDAVELAGEIGADGDRSTSEPGLFMLRLNERVYSLRAENAREAQRWVAGLKLRQTGKTSPAAPVPVATPPLFVRSEAAVASLVSNAAPTAHGESLSLSPHASSWLPATGWEVRDAVLHARSASPGVLVRVLPLTHLMIMIAFPQKGSGATAGARGCPVPCCSVQ